MAIGTATRLLNVSPFLTPQTRIFLSFPHHPLSINLKPSLPTSLRHIHKHLAVTPISASPLTNILTKPQLPSINLSHITPLSICKYSAILAFTITALKKTSSTLLSPFFWLYFSWTWLFWPYILALSLAIYGLYSATRHSTNQSTIVEQLAIVTSTITWLVLVPPAHFNGFLEGWPFILFFVYHYFFFFESSVRKRLYGDLLNREHDAKWDFGLPKPLKIGFFALVVVGHWLAAFEGVELHLISGGCANLGVWVLVFAALFLRYHSVAYLAKYSEKVAVPMNVVQFGPYRWVRHPIYASTMLLFAIHCVTLRAPLSLLFLMGVCLCYYGKKAELEEVVMVESFGEMYMEYREKVRYRLIPFLY